MSANRITVGEPARDFTLMNTQDEPVTLSGFTGKKLVYLVFNRGFT